MLSYEAFNVENASVLFRDGADEIGKVDGPYDIVVGKVVVCADKIGNLIKKTQKEFEASIELDVRERMRIALERNLEMRIRNTGHLWEVLRISSKHMNNIGQAPKTERIKARKICACLSELFPD